MKLEIWRSGGTNSGADPITAQAVEEDGWDGQMFMDSQCLSADPYAQMGVWACSTERLLLSTGVTNPLTRNLAVIAAAAATIQSISNGRSVLGIGRGDSALAYLGHAPVGLAAFERALVQLQVLLSGGEIAFGEFGSSGEAPELHSISLGARPQGVGLRWLPEGMAKVPLDVAATGPKVIAMAARLAERVTFSVGAEAERLDWALALARGVCADRPPGACEVSFGAQLVVICHPDTEEAMAQAMQLAPPLARFQVIQGKAAGPRDSEMADNLETVRHGYDMTKHGDLAASGKIVGGGLTPEFVRRFAIVGEPDHCTRRLLELRKLGINRFVVVGPGFYPQRWGEAGRLFETEVIPALRAA